MLAWGMLDSRAGYERAGQWGNAIASLRWATDYMIRVKELYSVSCVNIHLFDIPQIHPSANELYVQVGNGNEDHSFWGRPEQWTGR